MKGKNKTQLSLILGILFFSFFGLTPTKAASNVFCVYYQGSGPSNNCILKDKTQFNNPVGDTIPDELQKDTGFPCSWYANGDVTYKDSKGETQVQPVDSSVEVVHPVNLVGGYEWYVDKPSGTATAAILCPQVNGYTPMLSEKNLVYGAALFTMQNNVLIGVPFGNKLQQKLDEAKDTFETFYKDLVALSSQLCCLPKKEDTFGTLNSSCLSPGVRDSFLPKNLNSDTTVLAKFQTITPGVTNPNDVQVAQFFYCGNENGNQGNIGDSSSQYTLVYRPTKEYCLCTSDNKKCEPKGYPFLEDKPGVPGCDSQKEKKSTGGVEWKCIVNGVSKTTSLDKVNSCLDLEINDDVIVDTPMNQGIDVSVLNKLGTVDPKVLIARAIKGLLGVVGSLSLVMFVYGGSLLMIDRGNADQAAKAKEILVWTSLGLAVIFAAYAIVDFIFEAF